MSAFDNILVFTIILFIILIIWRKVQDQTMLDTVNEIKDIIKSIGEGFKDKAEGAVKK